MTINPLDLLDSGNFQTYNRKVARELGNVNAAIMLSELINRYNYHKSHDELLTYKKHEGVWFYYTVDKCEERTILSRKEQETAIKVLENRELFDKRSIGIPPKRHFALNIENILEFVGGLKTLFIKSEKGVMKGPKGAKRNDLKGRNNKEPHEEPKKDNNSIPQESKKEAAPVVVFSIFNSLDIHESEKVKMSKNMDESKAVNLVNRVLKWKDRTSDLIGCRHILKEGVWEAWDDSVKVSDEETEDINRSWAIERINTSIVPGDIKAESLNKFFEFVVNGHSNTTTIDYKDNNFKNKFEKAIEKYKIIPKGNK